ncbi:UvrD-helicase domain-containing protein [bacterium]|nr:UvrD-helicase domain-containing protein [bacterium]
MSALAWTDEQRAAIQHAEGDLLLSAAAGSGKTAVLAERCFRLLSHPEHPCDPAAMLVVTFTEAAAAEMKKRIYLRVQRELIGGVTLLYPNGCTPEALHRLRLELDRAQISTLHSFCRRILLEHFESAGLDPGGQVMEEAEAQTLYLEMRKDALEDLYARGDADFLALVEACGESSVLEAVDRLAATWAATPHPAAWRQAVCEAYQSAAAAPDAHPWMQWQRTRVEEAVARLGREGRRLQAATHGLEEIIDRDLSFLAALGRACHERPWQEFVGLVRDGDKPTTFRAPKGADPAAKDRVHAWHKDILAALGAWRAGNRGYPLFTQEEMARDAADLLPRVHALFSTTLAVEERYTREKRRRRRLDFNDLERLAYRILVDESGAPTPVALEDRRRFEHVLVDESQDINPLQEAILAAVSRTGADDGAPKRFMVGDVKQSIYGFRQADCGIFLCKLRAFTAAASSRTPQDSGRQGRRADLSRNFRSRPEVLAAVNAVCEVWMGEATGCPPYDESARLHPAARYPDPPAGLKTFAGVPAALHLFETRVPEDATHPAEIEAQSVQREAAGVAERIAELLAAGWHVAHGDGYRPLRAGDVVILLRTAKNRARHFMEALLRRNIPVLGPEDPAGGFAFELSDFCALLTILDNPRQDIPLAAVLRSPLLRLSDESLLRLRAAHPSGDLWDALAPLMDCGSLLPRERLPSTIAPASSRTPEAQERRRLAEFLSDFARWRQRARQSPMSDLLLFLMRETGYLEYVTATDGGRHRRTNLLRLLEHARRFDDSGQSGLARFLEYLTTAEAGGQAVSLEDDGQSPDAVRIMTIHQSKGLEFPVVIVPDLTKKINFKDARRRIVAGSQPLLGLPVSQGAAGDFFPTLPLCMARNAVMLKTLEEELRLLYVAMTRAREHLILTLGVENLSDTLEKAVGRPLPAREVLLGSWEATRAMSDWLLPLLSPPAADCDAWPALAGAWRVERRRRPVRVLVGARPDRSPDHEEDFWKAILDGGAGKQPGRLRSPRVAAGFAALPRSRQDGRLRTQTSHDAGKRSGRIPPVAPSRAPARAPAFLSGPELSPTRRGTILHGVFQYWDRRAGPDDVEREAAPPTASGASLQPRGGRHRP